MRGAIEQLACVDRTSAIVCLSNFKGANFDFLLFRHIIEVVAPGPTTLSKRCLSQTELTPPKT